MSVLMAVFDRCLSTGALAASPRGAHDANTYPEEPP